MNNIPRQTLQSIVTQYGQSIVNDFRRCEALLRDLCPECKREINILIAALKANTASEILTASNLLPKDLLFAKLTRQLYEDYGMAEEFAQWAVESWGFALGCQFTPRAPHVEKEKARGKPEPVKSNDQQFEFDVITVDARGKEIKRIRNKAYQQTEDLGGGVSLEMVQIPAGTFMMGSPEKEADRSNDENPQHRVTLSSFYMGKYPVTQRQWETLMGNNPSKFKGGNRPVECVSWLEAVQFCEKLFQMTSKKFRLPTEAEWEYACRAGTTTPFYFGETITPDIVNYDGNYPYGDAAKGKYREQTIGVGGFPPNSFGLYDMHGNVWEWCLDIYGDSAYSATQTENPIYIDGRRYNIYTVHNDDIYMDSGSDRVIRGGSWISFAQLCRSAIRHRDAPSHRGVPLGFRLARTS